MTKVKLAYFDVFDTAKDAEKLENLPFWKEKTMSNGLAGLGTKSPQALERFMSGQIRQETMQDGSENDLETPNCENTEHPESFNEGTVRILREVATRLINLANTLEQIEACTDEDVEPGTEVTTEFEANDGEGQ